MTYPFSSVCSSFPHAGETTQFFIASLLAELGSEQERQQLLEAVSIEQGSIKISLHYRSNEGWLFNPSTPGFPQRYASHLRGCLAARELFRDTKSIALAGLAFELERMAGIAITTSYCYMPAATTDARIRLRQKNLQIDLQIIRSCVNTTFGVGYEDSNGIIKLTACRKRNVQHQLAIIDLGSASSIWGAISSGKVRLVVKALLGIDDTFVLRCKSRNLIW